MDFEATVVLTIMLVVFAGAGGAILWHRARLGREVALMSRTATSSAAAVAGIAPGTLVELKGMLRCAVPVVGAFSQQTSAYFVAHVEREIVSYSRDSKGSRKRTTRRETVEKTVRWGPCAVADDTGQVAIDFEGAEVEAVETSKRFEPASGVGSLVGSLLGAGGGETGRHYTETALMADQPVYVLGTVRDNGMIGKSADGKAPYVISHKSEEERTKSLRSTRFWLLLGAILFLGVAIVIAGIVLLGQMSPR